MSEQPGRSPVLGHRGHALSSHLSEADAQFRVWMHENLDRAAAHFGLTVIGEPRRGWLDRSISAPVQGPAEQMWLRVVSEDRQDPLPGPTAS